MKLVMTEMRRTRDGLMGDLHELGLKHGVRMVVVSIQPPGQMTPMWIDHLEDTTAREAAEAMMTASLFLKDAAIAAALFAQEHEPAAPSPRPMFDADPAERDGR